MHLFSTNRSMFQGGEACGGGLGEQACRDGHGEPAQRARQNRPARDVHGFARRSTRRSVDRSTRNDLNPSFRHRRCLVNDDRSSLRKHRSSLRRHRSSLLDRSMFVSARPGLAETKNVPRCGSIVLRWRRIVLCCSIDRCSFGQGRSCPNEERSPLWEHRSLLQEHRLSLWKRRSSLREERCSSNERRSAFAAPLAS